MKPAPVNQAVKRIAIARMLSCLVVLFVLSGCATNHSARSDTSYRPGNVYRKNAFLPRELKRVAVLPLATAISNEPLEEGAEALDPILQAELGKSARFEVVAVSSDELRQWTGRAAWRASDALPGNFFAQLQAQTGCDAVMFCELTRYNAYQPVAIGWKFSLVEGSATGDANILWCADGVTDAGDPDAADAARKYQSQHVGNEWRAQGHSQILSSPRRFGQFTLCAVFGTLPDRKTR